MNFIFRRRFCLSKSVLVLAVAVSHLTVSSGNAVSANTPHLAATQDSAYVLKRAVQITPLRYMRWWQNPAAAEPVYNTWSWAPEIKIGIHGPLADGSKITVEFDTADGKPWFTQRMRTPELDPDRWDIVSEREDLSLEQLEKKAITAPAGPPNRADNLYGKKIMQDETGSLFLSCPPLPSSVRRQNRRD